MSKRVKRRLDPKDMSQPGIAARTRNLVPVGLLNSKTVEILKDCANQEDILRKYAPILLAALVEQSLDLTNPQVAANCKMYVLDKMYGKAVQPLLVSGEIKVSSGLVMMPINPQPEIIIAQPIEEDKAEDE